MDWNGIAAFLAALAVLLPVLAKFLYDIQELKNKNKKLSASNDLLHLRCDDLKTYQENLWRGVISRGYMEAQRLGYLSKGDDDRWRTSPKAKEIYKPKVDELKNINRAITICLRRPPTDYELSSSISQTNQLDDWMLANVCPVLDVNQYGCVAIACEIAKGNGYPN